MFGLDGSMTLLLVFCIFAAVAFEFINGFHDTANAVATVIYTRSMKPGVAVVWSGIMNFLGVLVGGITVAIGIMMLLPYELLQDHNISHNVALVLAILISAIFWNLGTWYLGIPCSSSHALLGSIFGVGIAYSFLPGVDAVALNWEKVEKTFLWLFLSPLCGFLLAWGFVSLLKKFVKYKKLYREPHPKKAPPFWVRLIIIVSSTHLSFSHGQNDGQKGVGLVMLILIAIVPVHFALNHGQLPSKLLVQVNTVEMVVSKLDSVPLNAQKKVGLIALKTRIDSTQKILEGVTNFNNLSKEQTWALHSNISKLEKETSAILSITPGEPAVPISKDDKKLLKDSFGEIKGYVEYAPKWVIIMISLALGMGTMIGWKRIVVTVGEKIGKEHLNYAQGASANIIAASTINLSSALGLPVSTTQILSSGVAGSMVATNGLKNLHMKTIKNIFIAWILTIPVTVVISGSLFLLFRAIF